MTLNTVIINIEYHLDLSNFIIFIFIL